MACDLWLPWRDEHLFSCCQAAWQGQILFGIANFGIFLTLKGLKILCHRLQKIMWPMTKGPTLHFGKLCDLWLKSWLKWYSALRKNQDILSFPDVINSDVFQCFWLISSWVSIWNFDTSIGSNFICLWMPHHVFSNNFLMILLVPPPSFEVNKWLTLLWHQLI